MRKTDVEAAAATRRRRQQAAGEKQQRRCRLQRLRRRRRRRWWCRLLVSKQVLRFVVAAPTPSSSSPLVLACSLACHRFSQKNFGPYDMTEAFQSPCTQHKELELNVSLSFFLSSSYTLHHFLRSFFAFIASLFYPIQFPSNASSLSAFLLLFELLVVRVPKASKYTMVAKFEVRINELSTRKQKCKSKM